jgi:hypothetical protein
MSGGVLLVVNCALESSYENRHVLHPMYRDRFDRVLFTVSPTCRPDDGFDTVAQRWEPPGAPACVCYNDELGPHGALRHSFHPRLVELAGIAAEFDFIVFTEDDCVISPSIDADSVRRRCGQRDCIAPPIWHCDRSNTSWVFTQHGTGYPAYDAVSHHFDRGRMLGHWADYGGGPLPEEEGPPMFYGFADWLVFEGEFFRRLVGDLRTLRDVWHEIAIPTAILQNTSRVGVSNGLVLWGTARDRPLEELTAILRDHDFVHPIKLRTYPPDAVLESYFA